MISIGDMHQGYIFRVWSVVLLVVQCYCVQLMFILFCLLYFISLLEGEGAGGGVLLLQLSTVCV